MKKILVAGIILLGLAIAQGSISIDSVRGLRAILNSKGTVSSVGATQPSQGITIAPTAVTTTGTFAFSLANGLAALEAIGDSATVGLLRKTGTDAYTIDTVLQTANFPALTGDIATPAGSLNTTIQPNTVTGAKILDNTIAAADQAQMPASTIKCNATTGVANEFDCTTIPVAVQGGLAGDSDPTWHGFAMQTDNVEGLGGGMKPTSGQPFAKIGRAVAAKASGASVTIWCEVTVVGATLTAAQNLIGVYTSPTVNGTYTRIGLSADQATAWTTLGAKSVAVTTSAAINVGDWVALLWLSVGTTTPTFRAAPANAIMTVAPIKRILGGTTAQTTLPSSFTIGTTAAATVLVGQAQAPFGALQ